MNENKIISANPAAKQAITGAIIEVNNELVFDNSSKLPFAY